LTLYFVSVYHKANRIPKEKLWHKR